MKEVLLFSLLKMMKQVCRNRRELATGHPEAKMTGGMDKSDSRPQLVSISFPPQKALAIGKKKNNG